MNTSIVNSIKLGMNSDSSNYNLQKGQYSFALNASLEDFDGNGFPNIQNSPSNFLGIEFPEGFYVMGRKHIPELNRVIFMLYNPTTGVSQIGEAKECNFDSTTDLKDFSICDDCTNTINKETTPLEKIEQSPYCLYREIVTAACLDFDLNHPIDIEYRKVNNSVYVYFVDDKNPLRFIYFDLIADSLVLQNKFKIVTGFDSNNCNVPIYSNELDCNKIRYNPNYQKPEITTLKDVAGGTLKAGSYEYLIAYADSLGNPLTPYFVQSEHYPIKTRDITIETNYQTNRAIYLEVEHLEQSNVFEYYNIVVAETIDNFTDFKLVATLPITTTSFTHTGDNQLIKKLTEDDVFFKSPIYEKAASITKASDFLFFARLKEYKKLNLQRAVNRIRPLWQSVALKEEILRKPENVNKYRGYLRDEVYALGLVFEMKDDNDTIVFPLTGPSKDRFTDIDYIVTNDDVINRDICETNCCDDTDGQTGILKIPLTIELNCSDNGCTEQGGISITFTFDTPTTQELVFNFGQVTEIFSGKVRVGDDIMDTIPAGTTPNQYYIITGRPAGYKIPFQVTVPSGSTTYTVPEVIFQKGLTGKPFAGWVCQPCDSPITDIYIKLDTASNIELDATIINEDIVLHTAQNIAEPPPVEEPTDCVDCNSSKFWQTYNTAFVIDDPHETIDDCGDEKIWENGEFAYWESTDKYPNIPEIWGDLCGKPIRHFKFPDSTVTHFHDGLDADKLFAESNYVYPIGVKIDHQSVLDALTWAVTNNLITQEDRDRIKGYRIVRGNRFGNKSIRAKGLLFDSWKYDKNGKTYYFPNYGYNDLRPDSFLAPNSDTYDEANDQAGNPMEFDKSGRYTFHSPDIHFTNTALGDELKLETEEYGQDEAYFNLCDRQPKYKFLSTASYSLAFAFGVAAAFSQLEEKECRDYTVKADYVTQQTDNGFSYVGTGGSFVNTLTPGTLVEATGTSGTSGNIDTHISATQHDMSLGTRTEDHNNQEFTPFRKTDGREIGPPIDVDTVTYKTCKGSTYQVLNDNGDLGGIGGFFNGIISILTGTTINGIFYRTFVGLTEMQIALDLFESLIPEKNYSIQHNSVGIYNNYKIIPNNQGIKIRDLLTREYIDPFITAIQEGNGLTTYFNNFMRERTVYMRTNPDKDFLPNPTVIDNSKTTMDEVGLGYTDLDVRFNRTISSYYGSLKDYVPNQYGSIYNVNYLETSSDSIDISTGSTQTVFGGDTFISRFALKRKHPFFIQTRFDQLNGADVQYQFLGNAAYPNYYFNTKQPLLERLGEIDIGDIFSSFSSFLENVLNVPKTRLDAKQESSFFYQKGYIHLYNYGIPYFLVESDVNVDFRHGEDIKDKDYYPRQKDLDYWLQEKNVPLERDNTYFYNNSYSVQNKESVLQTIKPNTKFGDNIVDDSNLLIYTERAKTLNETDNWRVILNDSWYRTDSFNGAIISADGIESDKVLIRGENVSEIFNAYDILSTENGQSQISTGRLFDSRPKQFAITDLGYFGSQNRDMLSTEFGHIFVDAKRANVFLLESGAAGMKDLAKDGKKNWFKNNLPFFLKKDFPDLTITELDNTYKGLGLTLCFDRRFNRIFLTKKDYKLKDPTIVHTGGEFYLPGGDTQITCPEGYTLREDNKCVKTILKEAEKVNSLPSFVGIGRKAEEYTSNGTAIYDTYNADGTGTFTLINNILTSNFWINSPSSSLSGPLNRCGIWNSSSNEPYNQWVGGAKEINVTETKTYYVGIGADNLGKIRLACDDLVLFDADAMARNHNFFIFDDPNGIPNTQVTFKFWHIYPVTLTAGKHYIEMYGLNEGSIAVFGAEIYDNTKEELQAANSLSDLNIIFSTQEFIGKTIDNFNYSCADCEPPVLVDGKYYCYGVDVKDPTVVTTMRPVSLDDERYFENKSWTISYNLQTETWESFHSFIPNYYIDYLDYFQSGLNNTIQSTLWSHNISNKSYQVFYGKLEPFIIDCGSEFSIVNNNINSIEYATEALRYQNEYDCYYNNSVTFNKAVVYNNFQNSGLLNLVVKNENDFSQDLPKLSQTGIDIRVTNAEGNWRFNEFFDATSSKYNNIPIWLNDANNANKTLNPKSLDYYKKDSDQALIRGKICNVRLINDKWSNYKLIYLFNLFGQTTSFK